MDTNPQAGSFDALLAQIEQEINAGFAFVATARQASLSHNPSAANRAIQKALHSQQSAEAGLDNTPRSKVRSLTHQIVELREAIIWLQDSYLLPSHHSSSS